MELLNNSNKRLVKAILLKGGGWRSELLIHEPVVSSCCYENSGARIMPFYNLCKRDVFSGDVIRRC